jgi:hypothetical protein
MAKNSAPLTAAEATIPEELHGEFRAFLADYGKACEEIGQKYIPNYKTFAYMIRHGWRRSGPFEI